MKLEEIQQLSEKKDVRMSIRTTESESEYMKKMNISPQLLWDFALREFKESHKNHKEVKQNGRK